jgi:hypothetical protein
VDAHHVEVNLHACTSNHTTWIKPAKDSSLF